HRDSPRAAEHGSQCRHHLVVRTIDDLLGAERVEPMRLDGRHDRPRLAVRWHEAEPSPGRDAVFRKAEDSIRERVAQAEVIEQPSVELRMAERERYFVDARRHVSESLLKRAPHTCTLSGSIFTIGFFSGVRLIPRYCRYFSRR